MISLLLSIGVLASLALLAGGAFILLRRPAHERKRGLLMLAVGLVTMINIWLWSTMPTPPAASGMAANPQE